MQPRMSVMYKWTYTAARQDHKDDSVSSGHLEIFPDNAIRNTELLIEFNCISSSGKLFMSL